MRTVQSAGGRAAAQPRRRSDARRPARARCFWAGQTLQRARLHVLERAQRWKEAYHYAIFHGHVAKSLAYMVRAGRQGDVIQMVLRQTGLAGGGKCVPVCTELVTCNQVGPTPPAAPRGRLPSVACF